MKTSEFRKLIREEIRKVVNEGRDSELSKLLNTINQEIKKDYSGDKLDFYTDKIEKLFECIEDREWDDFYDIAYDMALSIKKAVPQNWSFYKEKIELLLRNLPIVKSNFSFK
jgi:hypothetical protein